MSLTDSTMMPLGKKAPEFSLPDTVSGQTVSFADVAGEKGTVVMFICNHCPYVLHLIDEAVAVAATLTLTLALTLAVGLTRALS